MTAGPAAAGGAVAGGVARIASQVLGGCVALGLTPLLISQATQGFSQAEAELFGLSVGVATIPTLLVSLRIFLISGLVLGALGGLVGSAIAKRGGESGEGTDSGEMETM